MTPIPARRNVFELLPAHRRRYLNLLPNNPKICYHSWQRESHPESPGSQEEESLRCVIIVCTMLRLDLP
jgi:hypothetical protein